MASGHGVSEAIRIHVSTWLDPEAINLLYPIYQGHKGKLDRDTFTARIKDGDSWKRQSRKTTTDGFLREMYNDLLGGKNSTVKLIVHSPTSDMSADSYVFTINGIPVVGGKTKLKSAFHSTAVKDKVKTQALASTGEYVKFSQAELQAMSTRVEFGTGFESLEFERVI